MKFIKQQVPSVTLLPVDPDATFSVWWSWWFWSSSHKIHRWLPVGILYFLDYNATKICPSLNKPSRYIKPFIHSLKSKDAVAGIKNTFIQGSIDCRNWWSAQTDFKAHKMATYARNIEKLFGDEDPHKINIKFT